MVRMCVRVLSAPSLSVYNRTGCLSLSVCVFLKGNGKTMIAKCVAAECQSTFFSISASSITSKYVGDAERIMRTLFNLARERSPSIIFIDEIDSMLTARGGKNEAESSRRIKTEFLIQFDGVHKASDAAKRVLVIGATNLPDQLDEAVLRRFGKRILVPLPDEDTRRGLLRLLMSKQKTLLSNQDFEKVVKQSKGYSCSDLTTLCKDAAMGPIRSLGARILEIKDEADMPAIELKHFLGALQNVKPSLPEASLKYFMEWNTNFGSKIHLSSTALPNKMRPYTIEELEAIEREREAKEAAVLAERKAAEEEAERLRREDGQHSTRTTHSPGGPNSSNPLVGVRSPIQQQKKMQIIITQSAKCTGTHMQNRQPGYQ